MSQTQSFFFLPRLFLETWPLSSFIIDTVFLKGIEGDDSCLSLYQSTGEIYGRSISLLWKKCPCGLKITCFLPDIFKYIPPWCSFKTVSSISLVSVCRGMAFFNIYLGFRKFTECRKYWNRILSPIETFRHASCHYKQNIHGRLFIAFCCFSVIIDHLQIL